MNRRKRRILLAFFSILLFTTGRQAIWSQSGAGSIQGTITDATGAVIRKAVIHVVNDATGVAADTTSNNAGFYQVPGLYSGHYILRASAPGMETYTTAIQLLAAQDAVINPVLAAGAVTQQIVVTGNAVQLTTPDNGALSSTLENDRINQIPMNVRLLTGAIGETTPGIVMASGTQPRVNGLFTEALEYTIDGVPTSNDFHGGPYNEKVASIDPDSVQEVRMQTVAAGAQYAAPSTGIITTKSGTNHLHGSFFETARNSLIGVAKSREDPADYFEPHLVRNEFGASAGGPVILPHLYHGKDKTFWFFAYERYSYAASQVQLYKVPTAAMRQGDFSGLINKKGLLQVLYDPATTTNSSKCAATGKPNPYCRTPFPNNQIPIGEISPTAKIYYDLIPMPTSDANPLVTSNLTSLNAVYQVLPQENFRLDHSFDENNKAYLRFSDEISNTNTSGGPRSLAAHGIPAGAAEGYNNGPLGTILGGLGYTHIFSPTFFSETLLNQEWFFFTNTDGASPDLNYENMLGLPNNFGATGFPNLGNGNLIDSLGPSQSYQHESQIIATLDENLTKTVGRHQMQFGVRIRNHRGVIHPAGVNDVIGFSNGPTAIYNTGSGKNFSSVPNTGYADASFFLGSALSYKLSRQPLDINYAQREFDGYFQDNFHFSTRLTFNLGLRYEAHPAAEWRNYNLMNTFDLKNDAIVFPVPISKLVEQGYTSQATIANDENIGVKFETPQEAGIPGGSLMRNYDLNFLPRAGLALQPFGGKFGTVIRGAYGRYAYTTPLTYFLTGPAKNNPLVASYVQNYSTAAQAIDGLPNELLRYNDPAQFGVMGTDNNFVDTESTNAIVPGIALYSVSPVWPPTYTTETNFTVEQPLPGNSVLQASWVWTHATNLDLTQNYNHHPSKFQWEMATGTEEPTGGPSVLGTPQQNTYSTTATGPYDQTTWGNSSMHTKGGWSNYNALQVNYQRLFHHGVAYQFTYVQSHALRMGGDQTFGVDPVANYPGVMGTLATMTSPYGTPYQGVAPPAHPSNLPVWADFHAMDAFQGYMLDGVIPKQQFKMNAIIDLPFGRGKRYFNHANRFVDELVGGYQFAADVIVRSQVFHPSAGFWGPTNPLKIYKHRHPIVDCRSGVCYKAYLWFNGYLAPTVTTGVPGSVCTANCVSGLPSDYQPMQTPIDNTPGTDYYGEDEVQITAPNLNNGAPTDIAYDAGPQSTDYMEKTWISGPNNITTNDASIFKVFPITERTRLRVNMDVFNALNVQGYNNPGTDGVEQVQPGAGVASSHNAPRVIQLTMRLTF